MKNILEFLFSIKNEPEGVNKIIRIFGVKFFIKSRKLCAKKQKIQERKIRLNNIPVDSDKIVFSNYFGASYGCNPKYIAQEILRQKLPYKLVWILNGANQKKAEFPPQIKLVEFLSEESFDELASAKLWIDNTRKFPYWKMGLLKKDNQKYIQTWHGSLGLKKIEAAIDNENPDWRKWAKVDSRNIDYILSNSSYDYRMFRNDFWYDGKIVKTGNPRCDYFFSSEGIQENVRVKVKEILGIGKEYKICLYVPTFRDDGDVNCFKINPMPLLSSLEKRFGGKWVFLVRMHPYVNIDKEKIFTFNDSVFDASSYPDSSDLLLSADVVITDYSSCIFDFMFTRRPSFIFATDLDKYNTSRGFYYSITETPFSIAKDNNTLLKNVENFDEKKYVNAIDNFLKKHECIEDGNSSFRAVELVKEIMDS